MVGSAGDERMLEACLVAIGGQRGGAEVLVCESRRSADSLRRRFAWATFVHCPGQLVPVLWREGIDRARGRIVALTISAMLPGADWVEAIHAEHRRHDAVAGAIDAGPGLGPADWAEYLCRYSHDIPPFPPHECRALPGDNASYKRPLLDRTRELHRDGFWEPVVHDRLAEEGVRLWHTPNLLVRYARSAGAKAFIRQRLQHGRAHGRQRGVGFGTGRNLLGTVGWPLVPLLLTARVLRRVGSVRRMTVPALAALPLIFAFNVAWAAGEARGHMDVLTAGRRRNESSG